MPDSSPRRQGVERLPHGGRLADLARPADDLDAPRLLGEAGGQDLDHRSFICRRFTQCAE
jgi:hypothetical protein